MKRIALFFLVMLAASLAMGEGPRFSHEDPITDREFDNVYQDIRSLRSATSGDFLELSGGTMSGPIDMGSQLITSLAAATLGTHAARYSQVKILQVVMGTSDTAFSTTNTSFQSTNLSAAITPTSTSSKVLVFAFGTGTNNTAGEETHFTLARDTTNLGASAGLLRIASDSSANMPVGLSYLDSPASTSAQTYRVRIQVSGGTGGFGGSSNFRQVMILAEVNGL